MVPNINITTAIASSVHAALVGALFFPSLVRKPEEPRELHPAVEAADSPTIELGLEPGASGLMSASASISPPPPPGSRPLAPVEPAAAGTLGEQASPASNAPMAALESPDSKVVPGTPVALSTTTDIATAAAEATPGQPRVSVEGVERRGGAKGAAPSRRTAKKRTVAPENVRLVYEPVVLDMGSPGAADALLYGEGSPGYGHGATPPRIGGYVHWECPWPAAADRAGINHAVVHVTADVTAQGRATAVQLIDEPGYEFGPDAVRCALEQHYFPGRDAQGWPVAGRTLKFSVQFNRRGAPADPR